LVGKMGFETVEAVGPFPVRTAEPVIHWGQAVEPKSRWAALAVTDPTDQTGSLQHLEVFGDRGLRHRGGPCEFDDPGVAAHETLQDCPSGGVGKGRERAAQLIVSYHYLKVI
jgi:hypothetical protein